MIMINNQNHRAILELAEQQQKRIKYLENKVREYQSEISQLKYFTENKSK